MNSTELTSEQRATLLAPAHFIDSDHPSVIEFANRACGTLSEAKPKAIALYYAVRDQIRYNPHIATLDPDTLLASKTIADGGGFCIPKALLLAAVARAAGIPSRVGFADVRNHLSSEKLLQKMRTDLFVFHGYTELWLDDQWVKATPAFNLELCERFGVAPLEFDGSHDSLFHPFDSDGRKHMEYVYDHGTYADLPYTEFLTRFSAAYPHFFDATDVGQSKDRFQSGATREPTTKT